MFAANGIRILLAVDLWRAGDGGSSRFFLWLNVAAYLFRGEHEELQREGLS